MRNPIITSIKWFEYELQYYQLINVMDVPIITMHV